MLKASTKQVREGVAEIKKRYGSLVGQSVAASLQMTASIRVPPMIDRNIDKLFILGDLAGPSCLQLVRLLLQYNASVEEIASLVVTLNAEQWVEAIGHLDEHLVLLDGVIDKCEYEVRPIHDAIKG